MTVGPHTGLSGSVSLTVTADDTALAFGSGDVPVLATPRIVGLVEEAACAALADRVGPLQTSVGVRVEIDHRRPTRIGGSVTASALLTAIDGRRLDFTVTVREGEQEVASGLHRRVIVDRDVFA